jgi:hypothetical protein
MSKGFALMDTQETEVLHISIEIMRNGTLYMKEFSYASSGLVFTRTSRMSEHRDEDSWETKGWFRLNGHDGNPVCINPNTIHEVARIARYKGWNVEYNPTYDPSLYEFTKQVDFK